MPAVSYQRFMEEILEIYDLRARATRCKMRQALAEFGALEGVRKTSDIRPVLVARWLKAHPDRAPATADSILRSFRRACNLGVRSGYLRSSPVASTSEWVRCSGDAPDRRRHHALADLRRVLDLASAEARALPLEWKPARLEALVWLVTFTALRRDEALWLEWSDIDLPGRIVLIRAKDGNDLKTVASAAPVPIAPPLVPVLERWKERCGSTWVIPGVRRTAPWTGGPQGHKPLDQLKALGRRAGVEGLTFLSLRHSFATHAGRWGISALMLRAILRHTTVRTQRHYLHEDAPDLVAAVEHISFDVGDRRETA